MKQTKGSWWLITAGDFKEVIIIVIIALKGAIWDFYNLLTAPRTVSNTYAQVAWRRRSCVQITCNTSSAYPVQPAVCHLVQRDSSAIKCDSSNCIYFSFILLTGTINWWRKGGNRRIQRKSPDNELYESCKYGEYRLFEYLLFLLKLFLHQCYAYFLLLFSCPVTRWPCGDSDSAGGQEEGHLLQWQESPVWDWWRWEMVQSSKLQLV